MLKNGLFDITKAYFSLSKAPRKQKTKTANCYLLPRIYYYCQVIGLLQDVNYH